MKTKNIIVVHPQNDEQVHILKAFMKALKIRFEITDENPYNQDFIAKIKKSKQEIEKGDYIRVDKKDLENFLGLE